MAFNEFRIKSQSQVHYLSLMNFYQDDSFGNLINTSGRYVSWSVMQFVYDKFYFVEGYNHD